MGLSSFKQVEKDTAIDKSPCLAQHGAYPKPETSIEGVSWGRGGLRGRHLGLQGYSGFCGGSLFWDRTSNLCWALCWGDEESVGGLLSACKVCMEAFLKYGSYLWGA